MRAELALVEPSPDVIMLQPSVIARYRAYVEDLPAMHPASECPPSNKAAEAIRRRIETVTVWHGGNHGTVRVMYPRTPRRVAD